MQIYLDILATLTLHAGREAPELDGAIKEKTLPVSSLATQGSQTFWGHSEYE